MKRTYVAVFLMISFSMLLAATVFADPQRDAILTGLLAQAQKDDPGLTQFSAERGAAFFKATHKGGKEGLDSCTSCHGNTPQAKGQTRAGKAIEPMAVSKNSARYTNKDDVEKWFTRNCNVVLGRECTPKEKGDFIAYMMSE
jgi:cytochrome c553